MFLYVFGYKVLVELLSKRLPRCHMLNCAVRFSNSLPPDVYNTPEHISGVRNFLTYGAKKKLNDILNLYQPVNRILWVLIPIEFLSTALDKLLHQRIRVLLSTTTNDNLGS